MVLNLFPTARFCILATAAILALSSPAAIAQVTIEISPTYSSIADSSSLNIASNDNETVELPNPPLTDTYKLIYRLDRGSLRLVVFDKRDVQTRNPRPVFLLNKIVTGTSFTSIPSSPQVFQAVRITKEP